MATQNTVEYRATLDASGVKAGAQEAVQAINSINGAGAAQGLQSATTAAEKLGTTTASSANTAATALDSVSTAANTTGAALLTAGTQGSQGQEQLTKSTKETTNSQQQAKSAGDALIAMLRDQVAVSGKSAEELIRYRASQAGVAAEAAPLILQLQNQRAAQQAAAEAARAEEAAQREAAAGKLQAQRAAESFINSLRDQAATQGKSASEILRYRAAELGVADSAAQYIAAIEGGSNANKKGALSAKEHANAMRMLPMQMTDVVTSLASGMPVWMVAIQQGGQIKDSFHGVGNAAKALISAITPTVAAVGLLAGAAGLVATAYYQGSSEVSGYNKALIMSGNTAGVTASQMADMARSIGSVSGSQHEASQALTAIAATGAVAGESLQQFATIASNLERYAGQPVAKTAEQLAQLGDAPVKASLKLNEQYHYLTEEVYRQIKALEDKGQKDEAAALAQRTYAQAMAERADEMKGSLGTLERSWDTLGKMARSTWDAMLNVGRAATLSDIRGKIDDTTRQLNDLLTGDGFDSTGGGAAVGGGARGRAAQIERLRKSLGELNAQAAPMEAAELQAQAKADEQAKSAAELAARQRIDTMRKHVRTKAEIRKEEIAQLDRDRETLKLKQDEYDKLLTGINEKYKDPKKAGSSGGITVSDNELASMRAQLATAKAYHEQLLLLGPAATSMNQAERESAKIAEQLKLVTDAKTIARLKEKQAAADALAVQLRTNDGLEKSYQAHQKSIDALYADADAIEEQTKRQEAANKVWGKGRTAIEQMTLAQLEHQMAEAQGSDSFDPKYIEGLELKIARQKDWVAVLQQTDAKLLGQRGDELLRNAQELADAYEDELRLAGLTGLEREKIVAKRQVELKYAKELATIDRSSASDADKAAAREKVLEAQRIESAAQVSRAVQSYMGKAADDMNRSLTDAIMRWGESGKSTAEELARTIQNMFANMVLRPVISAIMTPISVSVTEIVQKVLGTLGVGNGADSSGSGGLGMPSFSMPGAKWFDDFGASLGESINNIGGRLYNMGVENFGESLMDLGSSISGASDVVNMFGDGLGYLNSIVQISQGSWGAGIGSAVGTWFGGPIGAAIGSYLGGIVDRIFGTRGANHSGGIYSTQGLSDADAAQRLTGHLGWKDPAEDFTRRGSAEASKTVKESVDELLAVYSDFAKVIKGAPQLDVIAGFASNPKYKDEGNYGYYQLLDKITGQVLRAVTDRNMTGTPEEAFKQFMSNLGKDMFVEMGKAGPAWFKAEIDKLGDAPSLEALQQALTTIKKIDTAFSLWNDTVNGFSSLNDDARTRMLQTAGGIDNLASVMSTFYDGFYSESEKAAAKQQQLTKQLANLGVDFKVESGGGDAAKAQYRKLIEDTMQAGNAELAYQLMALSGLFREVADSSVAAVDGIATASQVLQSLAADQQKLEAELLRARGDEAGYAAAMRDIETKGYTDAERAAYDYNAALRAQIDATNAAADAARAAAQERYNIETELLQAQGNTAELRRRELEALDPGNRALKEQVWAQQEANAAAQAAADAASRQADELRAAAEAAEQHAQAVAQEAASLENRYLTLIGDTATLRQRELSALDPSNRALQQQIWALEDARAAQQKYTDTLSKAQSAYDSAVSKVQSAQSTVNSIRSQATSNYVTAAKAYADAQQRVVDIQRQAAQAMRDIGNSLLDWVHDASSSGNLSATQQARVSGIEYQRLLALAAAGDKDALGKLTGAADKYGDASDAVNSRYDAARIRAQIVRDIEALGLTLANTALPGGNQPSEMDAALAAVTAAQAAMNAARDVALAIGAPLQETTNSLIAQYTAALQGLNDAQASMAAQQAALDSIKSGVWDTSTKTGQVNSSVGAGTISTSNSLGSVYNATGQVKGSTDLVKNSVDALGQILSAIKDQTWWLTGINQNTLGMDSRLYQIMNSLGYQNWAFTSDGYVRVQSQNRGGSAMWFQKGGLVTSPTLFSFGGGQLGGAGEASTEAIMPTVRTANGDLGVRVELPAMRYPAVFAQRDDSAMLSALDGLRQQNRGILELLDHVLSASTGSWLELQSAARSLRRLVSDPKQVYTDSKVPLHTQIVEATS